MTFEKVFEIFKKQIELDSKLEVIKFSRGYRVFIWSDSEEDYIPNGMLIKTPDELFDALLYETRHYYELLYTNPATDEISEEHKAEIEKIITDLKKSAE